MENSDDLDLTWPGPVVNHMMRDVKPSVTLPDMATILTDCWIVRDADDPLAQLVEIEIGLVPAPFFQGVEPDIHQVIFSTRLFENPKHQRNPILPSAGLSV